MKNEVYQPTATDNLTSAEDGENETYVPEQSISLLWKIVIAILLLLSIILMISLIVVSKKVKNQDDCPVCIPCSTIATTTIQSITTANTTTG